MCESEHQVAAYDDAAALDARVAVFVGRSLLQGVPALTVSGPARRQAVDDLLADLGVDPVRARRNGRLVTRDADETLDLLMVEGLPDPYLFAAVLGSSVPSGRRPVSIFGEMVARLWDRDEVVAALELESLWNKALAEHPIQLLCAYPGELLAGADLGDVARMCELHDRVSLLGEHPGAGQVPTAGDAVSSVHLPVPAAVASVRHFVRDTLIAWHLDDLVGDVALVTSELATNAITHGGSPFRTSLARTGAGVRISVEDGSSAWPEPHQASPGDQDGRGMAIVATLSDRAGYDSTPTGKVAWAELSLP